MTSPGDTFRFASDRFGQLEVSKSAVIELMGGIIGFPECRRYVLLDYTPPFSWFHSIENASLAFVVVNAAEFGEHYVFQLPYNDKELDLKKEDDVAILNIVSVRPDPSLTTVNLKAPIIVNLRNHRGRQIILDDSRFPTRLTLWSGNSDTKSE